MKEEHTCSAKGCERPAFARGMCHRDYKRARRNGSLLRLTDDSRFYGNVQRSVLDCWLWTGSKVRGYGRFGFRSKDQLAHRVSWILTHGEIPDGLLVLHRCDVKACIRPSHLFLGTQQDNMDDMVFKQRQNAPRGERSGQAKLTEKDVQSIREYHEAKVFTQKVLGEIFGISRRQIYSIVRREHWRHVAPSF